MIQLKFNSMEELIEYSHTLYNSGKYKGKGLEYNTVYISKKKGSDFDGYCGNIDEYNELLKNYIIEGSSEFINIEGNNEIGVNRVVSCEGEFNEIGAYMMGLPECMITSEFVECNRFLKIAIDTGVPGKLSSKEISKKYVEIFKIVNQLELQGIKCRIELVKGSTKSAIFFDENDLMFTVCVKDYEQTILPTYHSTTIAHVSTNRTIFFALISLFIDNMIWYSIKPVSYTHLTLPTTR
jgi:hypothetical protein